MPEDKENDRQERMVELLEELLMWTRVTGLPQVRKVLSEFLQSDEQKRAYFYSDGKKTRDEVAELAGCGESTMTVWWKAWIGAGIAEPVTGRGGDRARSLFSLDQFGIKMPQLKKATEGKDKVPQVDTDSQRGRDSTSST